jgi:hypothetical protein
LASGASSFSGIQILQEQAQGQERQKAWKECRTGTDSISRRTAGFRETPLRPLEKLMEKIIRCAKCLSEFKLVGNQGSQSEMRDERVDCPFCGEPREVKWPKNQPFRKIPQATDPCVCGHPLSSHNFSKEAESDPAIRTEGRRGNIYTGAPVGETRCSKCDCLTWRPKQS